MMRTVTAALGALTILAVTGAITTSGQTLLGLRPSAQALSSVTVIKDTQAPAVAPSAPAATASEEAPVTPPRAGSGSARSAKPAAPAPAAARKPAVQQPAAQSPSVPGGLGTGLAQVASVANILLNLPQVLSHPGRGPAPSDAQSAPWNTDYVPQKHHRSDQQEGDRR